MWFNSFSVSGNSIIYTTCYHLYIFSVLNKKYNILIEKKGTCGTYNTVCMSKVFTKMYLNYWYIQSLKKMPHPQKKNQNCEIVYFREPEIGYTPV